MVQNLYVDAENTKKLLDSAEGWNKTQAGEIDDLKSQVGQCQKSIEVEKKMVENGRRALESAGKAGDLNLGEIVKLNEKICTLNGSVMEKNGELSKMKAKMTQFEDESATHLTHIKNLMKRLGKLENVEKKLLETTKNLTTTDKNLTTSDKNLSELSQKFFELESQAELSSAEIDTLRIEKEKLQRFLENILKGEKTLKAKVATVTIESTQEKVTLKFPPIKIFQRPSTMPI